MMTAALGFFKWVFVKIVHRMIFFWFYRITPQLNTASILCHAVRQKIKQTTTTPKNM